MQAASLAVAMIGQAPAQARGLVTKQVDRLLSNNGIAARQFQRRIASPSFQASTRHPRPSGE